MDWKNDEWVRCQNLRIHYTFSTIMKCRDVGRSVSNTPHKNSILKRILSCVCKHRVSRQVLDTLQLIKHMKVGVLKFLFLKYFNAFFRRNFKGFLHSAVKCLICKAILKHELSVQVMSFTQDLLQHHQKQALFSSKAQKTGFSIRKRN